MFLLSSFSDSVFFYYLSALSSKKNKWWGEEDQWPCLLARAGISILTYPHSQSPNCSAFPRLNSLSKSLQTSIVSIPSKESYSFLHLVLFFFLNNRYSLIYLFIFGCVGSPPLRKGPLQLRQAGATLHRGAWASHHRGPSCWEHRLQMCRLSSRGPRAQLLRGMWDPPRPRLEHVSPALAGRLSTTAPPGKPCTFW